MTKNFLFKSLVLSCALWGLSACSDDEQGWPVVDGGTPQVDLAMSRIRTDYDLTFQIKGKIADADGIASIKLVCEGLSLNKTIDIIDIYEKPLTEYDLDYSYTVNTDYLTDFSGDYEIAVTVTDVAGKSESQTVKVTFDADFQAPSFTQSPDTEVTVLIKEKTLFNLKFTVEDNRNLDYVEVDLEGVEGYPVRIDANGESKVIYANALELPSVPQNYNLSIVAYDMPAQNDEVRSTTIESVVKVQELPDFDRVYLADVSTAEELNSDVFGVPMVCDHVGPFQYRARYYNATAGTQVCFIPQKTDFLPICWGPDPSNEGFFADDPDQSGKITLDQAGVYYKIDFNTKTGAYSVSTYSIAEAYDPVQNMHYGQNDLNTWNDWNVEEPWWQEWYFGPTYNAPGTIEVRFVQDKVNPHIYVSEEWQLPAGKMNSWILHNWHSHGWWNCTAWRMDDEADPSRCAYYGYYFAADRVEKYGVFKNNKAYFEQKYINIDPEEYKFMYPEGGSAFNLDSWGVCDIHEDYAKKFVPDVKASPEVKTAGKYKIWFDAHTERIKLIPAK